MAEALYWIRIAIGHPVHGLACRRNSDQFRRRFTIQFRSFIGLLAAVPGAGVLRPPKHSVADVAHLRAVIDLLEALRAQISQLPMRGANAVISIPGNDGLKPWQ